MKGASASTLAASASTAPIRQRNTASGTSQRLPGPLRTHALRQLRRRAEGAPQHDEPARHLAAPLDHATPSEGCAGAPRLTMRVGPATSTSMPLRRKVEYPSTT